MASASEESVAQKYRYRTTLCLGVFLGLVTALLLAGDYFRSQGIGPGRFRPEEFDSNETMAAFLYFGLSMALPSLLVISYNLAPSVYKKAEDIKYPEKPTKLAFWFLVLVCIGSVVHLAVSIFCREVTVIKPSSLGVRPSDRLLGFWAGRRPSAVGVGLRFFGLRDREEAS